MKLKTSIDKNGMK